MLTNTSANAKTVSIKQRLKGRKIAESQKKYLCAPGVEGEWGRKTKKLLINVLAVLNMLLLLTTYQKS